MAGGSPGQTETHRTAAAAARTRRAGAVALKVLPDVAIDAGFLGRGVRHALRHGVVGFEDVFDHGSDGMGRRRDSPGHVFDGVVDAHFPGVALGFHRIASQSTG